MIMDSNPQPVADPRQAPTIVFVSTHGSLRNWAEKRLYEPLVGTHNIEAIFWDRIGIIGPQGWDEAARYHIGCHAYPGGPWGMRELLRYFGYIMRELDEIEARVGLDVVVACDTDVLPAVIWHRLKRGLRYRVFRQEGDYYSGSRHRGKSLKARVMRWAFDAIEAVLHTQCDVIFTLNPYAARRITSWGIPANRVKVTGLWKKDEYFAEDHEAWKPRLRDQGTLTPAQYEALRGKIVVSFMGFFYDFTHLQELLDVVAKFPDDVALVLAGRGKDQPIVEDYARRYPNILFLGWHDESELKALYKITDIVYQPLNPDENINWRYFGSTNKTFESLAAGCLFIGSAINERTDMNREAEFALLIDFSRDIRRQIEDLFRSILADRNELTRRQRNARKLYERYNHANHARIWRGLVGGRNRCESLSTSTER